MSHIQAVLLSKDYFSLREANKWIKEHKYRPIKKVHSTINFYRYRLKEPNDKYDYRIKILSRGIKAVIGFYPSDYYR